MTVALSPGSLNVIGSVRITSGDGLTVYGTSDNPVSETVTIPTTGPVLPRPTPAEYTHRVEIIPKSHAAMPAVPGAEVAVTGLVTAVTTSVGTYKVYNDTTSATLTVDNLSPGNPAGAVAVPLESGFSVNWTNPGDADFASTLIVRSTAPVADVPAEGVIYQPGTLIGTSTVVYVGNGQSFIEQGLNKNATYYYLLFARDTHGNYSTGIGIGPLQPQPNVKTVVGNATAVIQGLDAITVSMPHTDDSNSNGTCTVEYKLSFAQNWTTWVTNATRTTSPFVTTITGLAAGSYYDVRMTYNDSDGVLGTASQTVNRIVALSLIQTMAGTATAAFNGSSAIEVTAPYFNDYNNDNTCLVEYKRSADADWITSSTYPHRSSPYIPSIAGLQSLVRYDVRVTYLDPDGVNGNSVQIIAGLVAPTAKNTRLIHNSKTANKKNHWSQYGGWGVPGGMYGEFTCATCHEYRASNVSGIKGFIPLGGPNVGGIVSFSGTGTSGFGDDTVARPNAPMTSRICEVCHSLTSAGGLYGSPAHRKIQNNPGGHNGDCLNCHKHDNGFASPW